MDSQVREMIKKVILIENPLHEDVFIHEKDIQLNSPHLFISSKFPIKI